MSDVLKRWLILGAIGILIIGGFRAEAWAQTSASSTPANSRVALVLGNANYAHIGKLKNPRNDAQDMCSALAKVGFKTYCHFDLASRADLRQAVRSFAAELKPGTVALFYFAGHAVQSRGDNFLLPVSIAPDSALDIEDDGLSMSYVLRTLEEARSAPNIVIIDACRDEPFASQSTLKVARGLARVDPPVGTVLVYATAPGGMALDGQDRNGLFTKHLLLHLLAPGQRLSDLFQVVALGVEEEARTRYKFEQVPYRSFSYSGSLCLAGCNDEQVALQVAELRARSDAAAQRIQALELENARLAKGRSEPTGPQATSADTLARDTEIKALRAQLQTLRAQAQQLEEYQRRIKALERENDEKTRRLVERDGESQPATTTRTIVVPTF